MLQVLRRLTAQAHRPPPLPMPPDAQQATPAIVNPAFEHDEADMPGEPDGGGAGLAGLAGSCTARVGGANRAACDPADFARADDPGPERPVVRVRISHRFLSSRPRVIDDFSGSSLSSMLRILQGYIRNLDGPDDIAGAIPSAFSKANQPYVEIGLLTCLFVLVLLSAIGAVRSARNAYALDYPARVRETLEQQRLVLGLLRLEGRTLQGHRVAAGTDADLDLLVRIHAAGVARHGTRAERRERGFLPLLGHNLQSRWQGVAGNGVLSGAFNQELREVIAGRMARTRIVATVEVCYQARLLERLECERRAAKETRTAELATAIGMPGMAAGMVLADARAATEAVANAATAAGDAVRAQAVTRAADGLSTVTSTVMMASQVSQGISGVLRVRLERQTHRQVQADLAAVRSLGDLAGDAALALYAQEAGSQSRASLLGQVFGAMLTSGQALMLASNVAALFGLPPVALALACPGASLTVLASIGDGIRAGRAERHRGADTVTCLQAFLAGGDLSDALGARGLEAVIGEQARAYTLAQRQLVFVRLMSDLLAVLAREDICKPADATGADARLARMASRNEAVRGRGPLLPAGLEALRVLRLACHEDGMFEGHPLQVQQRITDQLWVHPARAQVLEMPAFGQKVLYETLRDLAARRHAESWVLFHGPDGRRRETVAGDEAFFDHVRASPIAFAVYQQRFNEVLAGFLSPAGPHARSSRHQALGDLAHTRAMREALVAQGGGLDSADRLGAG